MLNPAEKIWWTKVAASFVVASITLVTQVSLGMAGTTSFMLGVLIYLLLSNLLSRFMGVDRIRGLKIGVGAYFFTWMMSWILLYTYIMTAG